MTDQKLSQLTASGALTGSELAYVVQSGNSRRTTTGAIAELAPATNLTYEAATRVLSSSTGEDVTLPLATDALDGLQSAAHRALSAALIAAGVTAAGSVVTIPHLHGDIAGSVYIHVKNTSAGTLTKGTPVRVTGAVGDTTTLEVAAADAASAGTMPAIGILGETLAPNATGHAVVAGELTNLATGSYSIGQALYVASGGGLTATKPTSGTIQQVAIVGRVNASTGSVTVTIGSLQSPNWDTAYSERLRWDGGATGLNAATGRTSLGLGSAAQAATTDLLNRGNHTGTQPANTISDFSAAVTGLFTTVGNALRSLANPSAVSFLRLNADNTVTARSASEMRGDLGLANVAASGAYSDLTGRPSLGTAAAGTIGTAAGNVVALDGSARLPAVDGSQLTNLPSATTPGGSTTQIQYNNAGAFAGLSTFTTDGTNVTLSGRLTNSANGAASAPPLALTGTWFTGGTATTTKPQFLIEPAGTTSTGWATAGTVFGVNAPSSFAGNLLDLQVNGTSVFRVSSGLSFGSGFNLFPNGPGMYFNGGGVNYFAVSASGIAVIRGDVGYFGFAPGNSALATADIELRRDAADTFAQRRGANAQTYRCYNTLTGTDVSATGNYERGYVGWSSNVFRIGTEKGSGGGTARALELQTDGTTRIQISRDGVWRNTQSTPAAVNTTATLTIANLQTGIITTTTAAAVDMTLPTGTDVEGGFAVNSNDLAFSWSIINTGGNAATILAATGHTIVGSPAVTANTSGRFTTRRTAANTYVTYRLS